LQKTLDDMVRLMEINREMAAAGDRDELLKKIIDFSLDLLGVERGTLFLYNPERNELTAKIATGINTIRVPADRGICGECIKTGKTVVIPDAYSDPRFNPDIDKTTGFKTRNIMSIPLRDHENKPVGVLQVLNRIDGDFSRHDVMLGETLGAQAGVIIQKSNLIQHLLQKREMEHAMQIARSIQRGLLPEIAPEIEGFDAAGLSDPADETGGDIYDFIPLPENRWGFMVADATGHGIGPALVISEMRSILRTAVLLGGNEVDIGKVLKIANNLLHDDLDDANLVTCFLGVLEQESGVLSYASAGHGPLLFYSASEDRFSRSKATGLPLGAMNDAPVPAVKKFHLNHSGDLMLIATDGVFEATNKNDEQFGVGRMEQVVRKHTGGTAAETVVSLREEVNRFASSMQADDITAVILKKT